MIKWSIPKDVRADVLALQKAKAKFPQLQLDAPLAIVYGSAGSGKTRWAAHIAMGGAGWLWCNARKLILEMRLCKKAQGTTDIEGQLQRASRLVIDDLADEGDERFSVDYSSYQPLEVLRRALMARCRPHMRTIITSNIKPESLAERYDHDDPEDPHDRGRLFSRFSDHARIYFFQGDRRKKEEFKFKERTHLDEGRGKDGAPRRRIELRDRILAVVPIYKVVEKPEELPDATEEDVIKAIDAVDDKGPLEVSCYNWLKESRFKNLIPEAWHEREKARVRQAKLEAESRKQQEKKQAAARAAGADDRGVGLPAGVQRGVGEGAGAGAGASGGDGAGGEVDTSSVPDWDQGGA